MNIATRRWLERNAKALQAVAAIVTAFAALAALIGIKVQIDANMKQQQVQSARDIYREFLNENYVEYMLYTADQLLGVSRDWEATMIEHLADHREFLCMQQDWSDDSEEIRALITRFRTKQCKGYQTSCG